MQRKQQHGIAALLLGALLLATWLCYAPGLGGTFHFDDPHNLQGLGQVHSADSALQFVLGGRAGPSGRPIALASFLLNAGDWPVAPENFLRINVLIHLLNGLLVAWLAFLLLCARRADHDDQQPAALLAAVTAGLWLLAPLLAPASLFIVQRMTTLSATFLFLGLVGYLKGRSLIDKRPLWGYLLAAGALGGGTLLSTLTKENGALLPLLALVIEVTLLAGHKPNQRFFRGFVVCVVALPALAVVAYLLQILFNSIGAPTTRPFTVAERVATQGIVLWDYLRLLLVPHAAEIAPYHDDYLAVSSVWQWPALLAGLGWVLALSGAVWWRRRAPLFAFAVLWYLAAQLMESGWIMLELYFEHRNYVPAFGIFFALAAVLAQVPVRYRRLAALSVGAYIAVFALTLWQVTSLWGQPLVAGQVWHQRHPTSARATAYLAEQYIWQGEMQKALALLRGAARQQDDIDFRLMALQVTCYTSGADLPKARLQSLIAAARHAEFSNLVDESMADLGSLVRDGKCDFGTAEFIELLDAFIANEVYQRSSGMMAALYFARANLYSHLHQVTPAVRSLRKVLEYQPDVDVHVILVGILAGAGRTQDAAQALAEARQAAPARPLQRRLWNQRLDEIEAVLAPHRNHSPHRAKQPTQE